MSGIPCSYQLIKTFVDFNYVFAFIPDFKLYLCPKNLSKTKPSDCAIPNYLYYAINYRLFIDM